MPGLLPDLSRLARAARHRPHGAGWAAFGVLVLVALVPMLRQPDAISALVWAGVAVTAWFATARQAASPAEPAPSAAPSASEPGSLAPLVEGVVPVWLGHLNTVREQSDTAINRLIESFASIKSQFELAGFVSAEDSTRHEKTFSLLTLCERQLHPVVKSMRHILEGKASMVQCVNDLSQAIKELQGMANEVGQIASHTNILAINAAIVAAHAGENGRAFGVVAKAIRELSQNSADTGKRISQRMSQIEDIMRDTVATATEASQHDSEAIDLSGRVIEDVLTHVRALGQSAQDLVEKGAMIRSDTDKLLVNLQFHDRVTQILGALEWDMQRLAGAVRSSTVPGASQWLAELSDRYTMLDQREAAGLAEPKAKAPAPAAEIEFF